MFMRQYDTMKIVTTEAVDHACSKSTFNDPVVDQALFQITSGKHDAERTVPGVVMQAAIGVTGEEAMNICAAASGQAEQVVAFQVGLAHISSDDAAAQQAGYFEQQFINEAGFFTHGVTG